MVSEKFMKDLKKRVIEISKKYKLAHIGSCLSTLPILEIIYSKKKSNDLVIMDNAHAHLSHLLVKEKFENFKDVEDILQKIGIHCDRKAGCDASGGSLGHAMGIAIGMSIVNPKRNVNVIVSDGSMMEGSNWEALRIRQQLSLKNLKIYAVFNGHSAVASIDGNDLMFKMDNFAFDIGDIYYYFPDEEECKSIDWHYKKL